MSITRARICIDGVVQGVGFRPFVHRLATTLGLCGTVANTAQGVAIEAEGELPRLQRFLISLKDEKPAQARIENIQCSFLEPVGFAGFEIKITSHDGKKRAGILPDLAPCADCLRELLDPHDRRYLYPFINCTHCGPRFSILESLPYDRTNTSMKHFVMCAECEQEYHDPRSRRFHAQPNACPRCGPHLELWNERGNLLALEMDALFDAVQEMRLGRILALKSVGGFQLIVDARNEGAVRRLRDRKRREEKPFALMYPSLDKIRGDCGVGDVEAELLKSAAAPIVLLERRPGISIAPSVAPGNPNLGVLLPCSPLHHLLMSELNFPVVATSGNFSDEPICIDEHEARTRLRGIADFFLVHDRPIVRPVDDSVVRVMLGQETILRRARGYAPLPVKLPMADGGLRKDGDLRAAPSAIPNPQSPIILAVGGQLKNSVALAVEDHLFVSQHIGNLESPQALDAFRAVSADLPSLYGVTPDAVACDLHPEYVSTKEAKAFGAPVIEVQHHYAHVAACMLEHELEAPVLGVAWDGTGYGLDGTIWGGEFLVVQPRQTTEQESPPFTRFAHFRNFPLPGGDAAARQPRRAALGLLWEMFGEKIFERRDLFPLRSFPENELSVLRSVLAGKVNAPLTSSVGRLFDGVASLLGLCQCMNFEGQAAMEVEFAANRANTRETFHRPPIARGSPLVINWEPMILEMIERRRSGQPAADCAAMFHQALAEIIVAIARRAGISKVALTGGCFQNRRLTESAVARLRAAGFEVYWHQRLPPNDGGIAPGQAIAALWQLQRNAGGDKRPHRKLRNSFNGAGLRKEERHCVSGRSRQSA
jgi:hydrogenase maturation protein HypF